MKLFNVSMMLSVQLTYILLFLSLCTSVISFPSTPLNERRQEISWQAWLLVDDQNQNRQNAGDSMLPRRRITPKSVFVAPTFSPENLPPCAEGYSSDSMGRCIKIIKLDEDRHLEFLVSKLNDKFGVIDYEEDVEEIETSKSEPFQLNIPLNLDENDYSNDTPQEDLDFAIIVTPTTRDSDMFSDEGSRVDKRNDQSDDGNLYEEELKKLLKMTTTKKYDKTTENTVLETSTSSDEEIFSTIKNTEEDRRESTTVQTVDETETTTIVTTTGDSVGETTTLEDNLVEELRSVTEYSDDVVATSTTDATTTLEGTTEIPTTEGTLKVISPSSSTPKISTTTPKITTYHPKVITYHPYFDLSILDNSKIKNLIKFPDDEPVIPRSHPDGGFVRFPDVDSKYQQESIVHHTRDVHDQSGNFYNEIVTSEPSQRVQEMVLPPKGPWKISSSGSEPRHLGSGSPGKLSVNFFPSLVRTEPAVHSPLVNHQNYEYQIGATTQKSPPKKYREKHGSMFLLPPQWTENSHQKPLVLRFSRKHFNVDTNKFKNNEFYRSLPMDDLSFLFGHKNGKTNHR